MNAQPDAPELEGDENAPGGPIVRAKWSIDGATTLAEAAQKAREFADCLQALHDEGWRLEGEIADDYGFCYMPPEGD